MLWKFGLRKESECEIIYFLLFSVDQKVELWITNHLQITSKIYFKFRIRAKDTDPPKTKKIDLRVSTWKMLSETALV